MASFDFSVASSAQRVCVADSDDRFEIWSVDAGEILPFRVDGNPLFVGGAGGLCAVVDVPGDYRIEFADDYCPEDNAPAFSVGPAAPADVCCVVPIKDADGKLVGLTIDGSDELFEAGGLEYTFPATVADDGVMVVEGSDGSTQTVTIEFPEDVDIASNSVVGGVVQFADSNGNPLPDLDIDLNPYISAPHPTIAASGDATATFDSVANEWTIGFVDTDTDTTYTLTQNAAGDTVLTPSDGSPAQVILNTDTDVSAVKLEWDTDRLRSIVTENGVDVVGDLVIPDGARECGDKALMIDPVTGGIESKALKPDLINVRGSISGTPLLTDMSAGSGVALNTWIYSDPTEKIIENTNTCHTVRIRLIPRMTTEHISSYSDVVNTTLHRLQISIDQGISWSTILTNFGNTHVHNDVNNVSANVISTNAYTNPEIVALVLPALSTGEVWFRVGHQVRATESLATRHTVSSQVFVSYRSEV